MTRREWLGCSGLAIAAGCGRKKGTGYEGYALIATAGENSLAAVDLMAFRLVKTIALGAPPTMVIAAQSSGRSYVLTPSDGTVYLIDADLKVAASRRLADQVSELRLSPDGKRLVGIAANARELIEADAGTLTVLRRRKLQGKPTGLDVSKSGFITVASAESGLVELFQLANEQRGQAQVDGRIGAVRFREDGKQLIVANLRDRSLSMLNVPELQAIADLQLAMVPENLCFTPDEGGQLFVSGAGLDAVAIVFPYNLEVEQTVLAGRDPGVMACSASPLYLFVGSNSGSDVSILNVNNRRAVGMVQVGARPAFIAITPDDQYALVLEEGTGDLAVIHISAIRVNRGHTGAALFTVLPIGEKPVHAAVVPRMPG